MNSTGPSDLKGYGRASLASGGAIIITPRISGRDQSQKQFVISNMGTITDADVLYLCDTEGTEAIAIFPQTAITLETDSPFRLSNPLDLAQADIPYCVAQLVNAHVGSGLA